MGTVHGRIKHIPLFSRQVQGWTAAAGGNLNETLELLPPRVASSNLRNYLLGLVIDFCGSVIEKTGPRTYTARQLHHLAGQLNFRDAWGQMLPSTWIDILTASNFSEHIQSPDKDGTMHGFTTVDETTYAYHHKVVLAYAPKAFSDAGEAVRGSKWDGLMPCCLLGKEAEINFMGVGQQYDANFYFTEAPVVTVTAVVLQSKELVRPNPTQIYDVLLARTTDPYVQEGESWKIEDLFLIYALTTDVTIAFWTSASEIYMDFDGHELLKGRAWELSQAIAMQRADNQGFKGTSIAGVETYNTNYYQGDAVTLVDADGFELATQGRAGKRLEIRGHAAIETRGDLRIVQRKRFECPGGLYERWCEKEGIPVGMRRDVRIGGKKAQDAGLSRSESIGVTVKVASRKERRV